MLNPEYGGDGVKTSGENAQNLLRHSPVIWAKWFVVLYRQHVPEKYKHARSSRFMDHGTAHQNRRRATLLLLFRLKMESQSGGLGSFADNFAGGEALCSPAKAKHRRCGLAQNPDGSLYVSDDAGGTIYKITYTGGK